MDYTGAENTTFKSLLPFLSTSEHSIDFISLLQIRSKQNRCNAQDNLLCALASPTQRVKKQAEAKQAQLPIA